MGGGAQYRFEIGAAIAAGGTVNTTDLAEELDLNKQSVNQELLLLESVGLLERMPKHERDGGRRVFFSPTNAGSAYWAWCREARDEANAMLKRGSPL